MPKKFSLGGGGQAVEFLSAWMNLDAIKSLQEPSTAFDAGSLGGIMK